MLQTTRKLFRTVLVKRTHEIRSIDEDFFVDLQDEIDRELRLMEAEEAETKALDQRIEELYRELHPSDNLRTIPGVGEHTAPVFAACIGEPTRFPSQSNLAFPPIFC